MPLSVLVVSGELVYPVSIPPDGELLVGRGSHAAIDLPDPKVSPRHLTLRPGRDGQLEVRDLKSGPTRLNDVQLSGASAARAGDQISLGDSLLLVQSAAAPSTRRPSPVPHAEFEDRLFGELARAKSARRPLALLLVRLPGAASDHRQALLANLVADARVSISGLTWGTFGGEVVELLCPESSGAALESLKDRVTSALGSRGQRFKLGPALYPEDGATADELLESALARLVGPFTAPVDEPMLLDPVMVRLHALLDRVAHSNRPVLLEGAPGAGKHHLARALHHRSRRAGSKFRLLRCPGLSEAQLDSALRRAADEAGTLYLSGLDELPASLQHKLAAALAKAAGPARLIFACDTASALEPRLAEALSFLRLSLPQLSDRPADVVPLAEHFLARSRRALGRAGLSLSAEARKALAGYGWPGNVRELKNAIERAALLSSSNEVGADELPQRVLSEAATREPGGSTGLRASMRAAEKDALSRALSTTGWNVTAAAKNLGLPRRTVVYRMARLGLRRPTR